MIKKKSTRVVLLAVEFFVCGYIIYTIVFHQQALMNQKRQEMIELQQKIKHEKRLTDKLNKEKEKMQTDEYVEKVAREKLGMIKRNEKIFYER